MNEWLPLVAIVTVFSLSLTGAVVLFRFLKSSAIIKRKEYRAGGALAGFLLIFATLHLSFNEYSKNLDTSRPIEWTIVGKVNKAGSESHDQVNIQQIPERPYTVSRATGSFDLRGVKQMNDEGLPRIYVTSLDDRYHPVDIRINETNAEIDRHNHVIMLKEVVELSRIEAKKIGVEEAPQ